MRRFVRILAGVAALALCVFVIQVLSRDRAPSSTPSQAGVPRDVRDTPPLLEAVSKKSKEASAPSAVQDAGPMVVVEVLDEDHSPRAGVDVYVAEVSQWALARKPVADWPDRRGSTSSEGRLRTTARAGKHVVGVRDPRDGSSAVAVCTGPLCRIQLPGTPPLRLLVVSQAGEPVAGATIELSSVAGNGAWFRERHRSDAQGRVEIRLPDLMKEVLVRGGHADAGFGMLLVPMHRRSARLVLGGTHRARFLLRADSGDPQHADAWCVVSRSGVVLGSVHRRVALGEGPTQVGLVPHGAHVTVLIIADDDQVAYGQWKVTDDAVQELGLESGLGLTVRVEASAALRPLSLKLLPRRPYGEIWTCFPAVAARTERVVGDSDVVDFGRIPHEPLDGARIIALQNGGWLDVTPAALDLSEVAEDDQHEVPVRIEFAPGVTFGGRIVDTATSKPVPFVRVGLRSPGVSGLATVSDADGAYSVRTLRRLPLKVFFEAPGYVTETATVEAPADGNTVALDVRLAPHETDSSRAVRVRVQGPEGAGIGRAVCSWSLPDGTPLARVVTSGDGTSPPVRLPNGDAALHVVPPPDSRLRRHKGTYRIAGDEGIGVVLKNAPEVAAVLVRLGGAHKSGDAAGVLLMGARMYAAPVLHGSARLRNVRVGPYEIFVRTPDGALLSRGTVDVEAPDTIVRRQLDRLHATVVLAPGAKESATVILTEAETGRVLDTKPLSAAGRLTWKLPEGAYVAEVFSGHRHGKADLHVPSEGPIRVPLQHDAGTVTLAFLVQEASERILSVRFEGPVVRQWKSFVPIEEGRGRFMARGLPAGRYGIRVVTEGGAVYRETVDVVAGKTVAVPPIRVDTK